jgi:3-phenylpropionate/trans-cinnamate dioxygenase ferredoxin reductase component
MRAVRVDVLLVGGGVAAARCARTLRRRGFSGSILLVGDEPMPPYNRPPLSKEVLREDVPDELLTAEPPSWYERHAVTLRLGAVVEGLDLGRRVATLGDGSAVAFGHCVLATGAAPRPLPVAGGERARTLRTVQDARRIRADARGLRPDDGVVVVGGGLLGVELASGLVPVGLRPLVVEASSQLWGGGFGELLSAWATERLMAAGIRVRLGQRVTAVRPAAVEVAGAVEPAALVVAAIGVVPRAELAAAAGLDVDGGVPVGADGRAAEALWAAGDVARVEGSTGGHWHAARESGERAALSILGLAVPPPRAPWAFTEVLGTPLDVLGEADPDADEMWVAEDAVIARTERGAVRQLIVIGGALPADAGRSLVDGGASHTDVRVALAATRG